MKEWPSAELLADVEENFPEAGVANVEEARVRHLLWFVRSRGRC